MSTTEFEERVKEMYGPDVHAQLVEDTSKEEGTLTWARLNSLLDGILNKYRDNQKDDATFAKQVPFTSYLR